MVMVPMTMGLRSSSLIARLPCRDGDSDAAAAAAAAAVAVDD